MEKDDREMKGYKLQARDKCFKIYQAITKIILLYYLKYKTLKKSTIFMLSNKHNFPVM